jgi:propanol-preferring alcohol dehydrogenase
MGLRVIGVDIAGKKDLVMECGAEHFFEATEDAEKLAEQVRGVTGGLGAKAVVMLHADNAAYAAATGLLSFGGTLVCVGMPDGEPVPIGGVHPNLMIARMLRVVGSAVGNRKDAVEVMQMAARGVVRTRVEVRGMDRLEETFRDMEARKLQGRVVLDLR